jgi:hypothetical protein
LTARMCRRCCERSALWGHDNMVCKSGDGMLMCHAQVPGSLRQHQQQEGSIRAHDMSYRHVKQLQQWLVEARAGEVKLLRRMLDNELRDVSRCAKHSASQHRGVAPDGRACMHCLASSRSTAWWHQAMQIKHQLR